VLSKQQGVQSTRDEGVSIKQRPDREIIIIGSRALGGPWPPQTGKWLYQIPEVSLQSIFTLKLSEWRRRQ